MRTRLAVSAAFIVACTMAFSPASAATGKIKSLHPPTNTGTQHGVGQIEETIDGVPQGAPYLIFSTPADNDGVELPIGTDVSFDRTGPGRRVTNVRAAAPAFAIISFAAVASGGSGSPLVHTLIWETSGARSGKIRYFRNDNGALTDVDITVAVASGSMVIHEADIAKPNGYTIIIYDGDGYTGNSLNQNATP
jgi:hypothetical protein